jgi:hypothetical protein
MKTDLSDMSLSSVRPSIGRLTAVLRAWNATDNTVTDEPVLDKTIAEDNVKIYVEGETPEALAERVREKVREQAQAAINYYQDENEKIGNVTSAFQSMITDVDGALTSRGK